ncbi:hypothetical protein [Trichothermofontia sichuanensis]
MAWVALARWQALTPEEQERFPPICPDFVAARGGDHGSASAFW